MPISSLVCAPRFDFHVFNGVSHFSVRGEAVVCDLVLFQSCDLGFLFLTPARFVIVGRRARTYDVFAVATGKLSADAFKTVLPLLGENIDPEKVCHMILSGSHMSYCV